MKVQFEDRRLLPVREKVEAGERLSYDDGIQLYRSNDLLALGYMANLVRERLHGDVTYFNVNRHINPTDVCVASCRLCAFGKQKRDPEPYTMSLEQVWETAGKGWSEADHRVPHCGRTASGAEPRLVLPDAARTEGALSRRST